MTPSGTAQWFWTPRPRPRAALRLMCFPHAGGDAPAFLNLAGDLPEDIEVRALRMPARGGRTAQEAADVHGLVAEVAGALADVEPPYAVLGQSLGCLVGFEAVRAAGREAAPVAFMALSAQPPDQFARWLRPMAASDGPPVDGEIPDALRFLFSYLRDTHQDMRDALDDPAVLRIVVRDIWADLVRFRGYRPAVMPRLDCPVHALSGTDDPSVRAEDMSGWGRFTTGKVTTTVLETGHFMLQAAGPLVARQVARLLAPWRDRAPHRTRHRTPERTPDRTREE